MRNKLHRETARAACFFDDEIASHYYDLTSTLCTTLNVTLGVYFPNEFLLKRCGSITPHRDAAIHRRSYITNLSRN